MTTLREAAQQALEALQAYGGHDPNCDYLVVLTSLPPQRKPCSCGLSANITALRAVLAEPVQEQEPLGWAVQIGTHSAGRRQGKPRYVLFFNKSDAEHLADRTRGARPEPFYLEEQR